MVLSSDGFHIESHIDSVPALARVKDLHDGLSSEQQALGRIVQSLLADADGLDGVQLYALSDAIESYRDAAVSYTHLTLPTIALLCRSRWSPYH